MNVFELAAKIAVDASEFKKGLNTSEKSISDFANKATKTLNTLKKVFIGVVSVATVKKIASGIFDLANATSQLGDRVDKQSQALGMSRKGFQEWDYILSQSGASIDSMGASMRTLNQAILSGNAESVNALKELGLSVESLSSMSQEQAFEATVKALQQLPPGAQKSALAMKLLGRGAQSLMPLLNSSAESVDALKKRAQELGLVMSDEAVDASVAFGDALDDLKRTMTAIKNTVGATLLPALTNGLIAVTNYAGKFRGYVQNAIETGDWKGLFKNIGGDVAEAARLLWIRITDTVPILWENAQQALLGSDSPILQAIGSLMQDISDAVKYISDHKQDFIDTFNEITGAIGSVVTTGIETVKSVFEWLENHGIGVQEIIKGIVAAFAVYKISTFASKLSSIGKTLASLPASTTIKIGYTLFLAATVVEAANDIVKEVNEQHSILGINLDFLWPDDEKIDKDAKPIGEKIKDAVTGWIHQNGVWYTAYTKAIDEKIVKPFEEKFNAFKEWFQENIIDKLKEKWEQIKTKVEEIVTACETAWDAIVEWFTTNIIDPIKGKWDEITSKVSEVVSAIESTFEAIVGWFDKHIIQPIKSAWDAIIDPIKEWLGITDTKNVVISVKQQAINDVLGSDNATAEGLANVMGFDLGDYYAEIEANKSGKPKASGLSFVPENDYLARLHFGEAVLSRNQAEKWRRGQSGEGGGIDISSFTNAIIAAVRQGMESANIQMDGETVTRHVNRRQAEDFMARRFANA